LDSACGLQAASFFLCLGISNKLLTELGTTNQLIGLMPAAYRISVHQTSLIVTSSFPFSPDDGTGRKDFQSLYLAILFSSMNKASLFNPDCRYGNRKQEHSFNLERNALHNNILKLVSLNNNR
jgi:hypothetical protein